ncbi:hypothetical protein GIB67_027303 [Kingdonia uniflora]|uniref:Uncharacterized protein n=1 Tax=Kingdonia uniflora TaxID=39325 RepID=A0A7J7KYK5_9MAGN|nr:hypothetical protein GIB67_027303 [Kingdonia uniflora]
MIAAEILLFGEALEDVANQRFVLRSDSCVPLHNFSYIYNYVMSSSRNFMDSLVDVKGDRYHPKMSSIIPKDKWRKGSKWIALVRRQAEVVVDDDIILPVFKKYCKRRPPIDPAKGKQNIKLQKQHNCIPDEHYVQTLLAMGEFEGELERRTLTYTSWNESKAKMEKTGWHPVTFRGRFASARETMVAVSGPKYGGKYLHSLIKENLGGTRLRHTLTNVVIPTFDIKRLQPTIFSSFEVKNKPSLDALLSDICISTSAAPTFLPAHHFVNEFLMEKLENSISLMDVWLLIIR